MTKQIYISGFYSGPSPSAGLGIARSLKKAFPSIKITGVDHWAGSSGLHAAEVDEALIFPPWDQLNLDQHAAFIKGVLEKGHYWISSLDLEVKWIGEAVGVHPRLLCPGPASLSPTLKPEVRCHELLPFLIPPQMADLTNDWEIASFCRNHSWRIWLKGPFHEATLVTNWKAFENARASMEKSMKTSNLFIQAHVRGLEESICFSAFQGKLLHAVSMEKRIITSEGKTWAGKIKKVPPDILESITHLAKTLHWTGGAELELIKDSDDKLWLMEINPRFPAWIYGTAISGENLPAILFAEASGLEYQESVLSKDGEFTRTVVEIPANSKLSLPLLKEPDLMIPSGKYGANLSTLIKRAEEIKDRGKSEERTPSPFVLPKLMREDLASLNFEALSTPHRVFFEKTAEDGFSTTRKMAHEGSSPTCKISPAYSFKTSPDDCYIELAKKNGFLAECISQKEVERALLKGFAPSEIVLNGPGKFWPSSLKCPSGLKALFCDSKEEIEKVLRNPELAETIGVRLRMPSIPSRFGIPIATPDDFLELAALISRFPQDKKIGLHYHMASSTIGVGRWWDAFDSLLAFGVALEEASQKPVSKIDLGGGWFPDDFRTLDLSEIVKRIEAALPSVDEVFIEPGKAITQPTMALVTRVLEVRRTGGKDCEVVVDACIAELPLAQVYPHRILWLGPSGEMVPLMAGKNKILGRICMEEDFLSSHVALPKEISENDTLIFCDAGAYERTMSYEFGRG